MLRKRYWHVKNKWKRHISLTGTPMLRPHLPPTSLLSRSTLRKYIAAYRTVYVKPVFGSFGNRIMKITKKTDGFDLQRENKTKHVKNTRKVVHKVFAYTKGEHYHLQKGIDLLQMDGHPIDFRILLLRPKRRWKMMGIMGKMATGKRIVTNYNHGGRPIRFTQALRSAGWNRREIDETSKRMERLCMMAAEQFQRKYKHCRRLGIDMAVDQDKRIWFIEVNTNPFYELFRYHENRKLYRKIHSKMQKIRRIQTNKW